MLISSPANQHLKLARGVRDGREADLLFVEGERLCEDLVNSDLTLVTCFHTPEPGPRAQEIISLAARRECPVFAVVPEALDAVSDTVNSQGIMMLAQRPAFSLAQVIEQAVERSGLLVCLDAVQDPGNFGTIVRTAEAAGACGVIALRGSVDGYAPKTLRSAMGSAFRLPVVTDVTGNEVIAGCRATGVITIATASEGQISYSDFHWIRQAALVIFGNEANGISDELIKHCDVTVNIPICEPVNSLNVSAAAAVILFEAVRQNSFGSRNCNFDYGIYLKTAQNEV